MEATMRQRRREDPAEVVRAHPLPEAYGVAPAPPAPRRRWGLPLALGACLSGVAVWLVLPGSAAAERDAALREARALGLPETIAQAVPPVADARNAAVPLERAFRLAAPPDVRDAYGRGPLSTALDDLLARRGDRDAALARLDAGLLPLLTEAASRPELRFARDRSVADLDVRFTEHAPLAAYGRYLALSAVRRAERGDGPEAMRRLIVAARLARHARRNPFTLPLLASLGIEREATFAAQRVLAATRADPATLAAARGFVPALGPAPSAREALRGEWVFQRASMARFAQDPAWARSDEERSAWPMDLDDLKERARWELLRTPRFLAANDRTVTRTFLDYYRALPEDPLDAAGFRRTDEAFQNRSVELGRTWTGFLAEPLAPVFPQVHLGVIRAEARRRAFSTLLDALARPDRAPVLPRDPFSDGPLRFRRDADGGVRVWSVGPDGRDDGGLTLDLRFAPNQGDPVATYPLTDAVLAADRARFEASRPRTN